MIQRDEFGAEEIIARINASSLHPFSSRANQPWLFDFVDLMASYYALDRFALRGADRWARHFIIKYPVRQHRAEAWHYAAPILRDLLLRITGDVVEIVAVPWEGTADRISHPVLPLNQEGSSVGLFSDGLDSLCGLDVAIADKRDIVWASITTGHKGKRIRETLDRSAVPAERRYSMSLMLGKGQNDKEHTQRSRTAVAIAMGMTLAYALDGAAVECYENGHGILNLPIPDLQYGSMSSQALNPSALPLWDTLTRILFGQTIELRFPNRFRTKGEMMRILSPTGRALIAATSSCDSERRLPGGEQQCGSCGSCVIRKISMRVAGIGDPTRYANVPPLVNVPRLLDYHATLLQHSLTSKDPWASLNLLHHELAGVDRSDDERLRRSTSSQTPQALRDATVNLLMRYVNEIKEWLRADYAA
ncbi:MAG: hypothetical protein KGN02_01285 [bacterium]|nr:hypothetical protein [bacterium]